MRREKGRVNFTSNPVRENRAVRFLKGCGKVVDKLGFVEKERVAWHGGELAGFGSKLRGKGDRGPREGVGRKEKGLGEEQR